MVHPDHLSSWGHHKVRPDRVAGFGDLAVSLSGVTVSGGGGVTGRVWHAVISCVRAPGTEKVPILVSPRGEPAARLD